MENGFFNGICRKAAEELVDGGEGWRELPPNVVILAGFHLLTNHLTHNLARPLWFFASSVVIGIISYIVFTILG